MHHVTRAANKGGRSVW